MQHTFVTYDSTQNYCRRNFHGGVNTLKLFQLFSNYIDVTDSLRPSLTGCLAVSTISPLFVDRFGRSLRGYLQFDKEIISDEKSHIFRMLSFCGPFGPCFLKEESKQILEAFHRQMKS